MNPLACVGLGLIFGVWIFVVSSEEKIHLDLVIAWDALGLALVIIGMLW